jgi:hypothetical protein
MPFFVGTPEFNVACPFYNAWNTSRQLVDVYEHAIELWESITPPRAGKGGWMQFTSSNARDCRAPFFMYYSLGDDNIKAQMLMRYNAGSIP